VIDPENFFRHAMWPRPGGPGESRQLGLDDTTGRARNIDLLCDGFVPDEETGDPKKGFSTGGAEGNVSEKAKAGFDKFEKLAGIDRSDEDTAPTPTPTKVMAAIKKIPGKEKEVEGLINE
jgi:hypothetical protein